MGDDTPCSVRNKAIVLLLAIYGLRSSEIAGIMLDDIDWSKDILIIRHIKRCRTQSYPLLPLAGNAILAYLCSSRQNFCKDRHLFLTMLPPYSAITRAIVYNVVSKAYKELNISVKHIGGHSLRHACASHLINSGETMKTVSDILGHRSINSTKTYAKVDLAGLAYVADMDWEVLL